jgi:tetratricopeptide (TPR) repeat protein
MFPDTSANLQNAIQALKAGDRARARQILQTILKSDPRNEDAWVMYAYASDKKEQALYCLQKALDINPFNEKAQKALQKLQGQPAKPPVSHVASPSPVHPLRSKKSKRAGFPTLLTVALVVFIGIGLLSGGVMAFMYLMPAVAPQTVMLPTPLPSSTPVPPPTPVPTEDDCNCQQANEYLNRTLARYDEMASEIATIEGANRDVSSQVFLNFSALAAARYKVQLGETPPPCLETFQSKTVSLFWNWQQTMQYAANGQYDAANVFVQSFIEQIATLAEEGEKIMNSLQGCPGGGSSGPDVQARASSSCQIF